MEKKLNIRDVAIAVLAENRSPSMALDELDFEIWKSGLTTLGMKGKTDTIQSLKGVLHGPAGKDIFGLAGKSRYMLHYIPEEPNIEQAIERLRQKRADDAREQTEIERLTKRCADLEGKLAESIVKNQLLRKKLRQIRQLTRGV